MTTILIANAIVFGFLFAIWSLSSGVNMLIKATLFTLCILNIGAFVVEEGYVVRSEKVNTLAE